MRAPDFWQKSAGGSLAVRLLRPVGMVYGWIVQARLKKPPVYRSALPVICVGNNTMGGSGKTPVVQAIVRTLQDLGATPAILLRGYGGAGTGCFWVTGETAAAISGDEALLHSRIAPTLVCADRAAGAREIEKRGYSHIVMDDGLQNPGLAKTLSLLVIDGDNPQGNGHVFPAGPLRETLTDAMARIDAVIWLGGRDTALLPGSDKPVLTARLEVLNGSEFVGRRVFGFAGIGRPQKFFDSLSGTGAEIVATRAYGDHHPYTGVDLQALASQAEQVGAELVTTRKDWVRLPEQFKSLVNVLDVALVWDDANAVAAILARPWRPV